MPSNDFKVAPNVGVLWMSKSQKEAFSTRNRTPDLPMVAIRASQLEHSATRDIRLRVDGVGDLESLVVPLIRHTAARFLTLYALRPTPYTLHPTTYTLHTAHYTVHPLPYTLHPTPCTLYPVPYTLHPTPYTLRYTPHTALVQLVHIRVRHQVSKRWFRVQGSGFRV